MQKPSVLKRHAALVDAMADTLGIDLEESILRGNLRVDDISDAVLSCTACANADACQGWLDDHKDGASKSPDYCRNAALFQHVRDAS